MRSRAGALLAVATLLLAVASGLGLAVRAAVPTELPSALHGAVETQAITAGNGALALFVDPGTAYAYSTLDRDDYGGGPPAFTMTARGATLNLGTIAYAVIWAAPDCSIQNAPCVLSGGLGTPNTGLHEAAGFPGYAEALYPPPPSSDGPSRERTYKCVVNKDAAGAAPSGGAAQDVCKQSSSVPLSAWAEAVGEEVRATGFSRYAGFDAGVVKVANQESSSDVRPLEGGKLRSQGYSEVNGIDVLDGQVRIEQVRASASIVSGADGGAERQVACGFTGLSIAGQAVSLNELASGGAQPLLDAVEAATSFRVQIIPPAPPVNGVTEAGKQVAGCSGIKVFVTDLRNGSPVPVCLPASPDPAVPACVPGLGNRLELTFGSILTQQSVNDFGPIGGGADPTADLGTLVDASGGGSGAAGNDSVYGNGTVLSLNDLDAPEGGLTDVIGGDGLAPAGTGSDTGTSPLATASLAASSRNLALIGGLTAAAGVALLVGVLLLVGVVRSLALGTPLRLPGW